MPLTASRIAVPLAPLSLRAVATVIDVVLCGAAMAAIFLTTAHPTQAGAWRLNTCWGAGLVLFLPGYFLVTEGVGNATLGKRLLNLRVVSEDGAEPQSGQLLKRNLVKALEAPALWSISCLLVLLRPSRQTLGDLWAGTVVTQVARWSAWRHGTDGQDFAAWLDSFRK